MITLETLKRIPQFTAVRESMRHTLKVHGAQCVRGMLDNFTIDVWDKPLADWIFFAEDQQTLNHRIKALYLVVEEWESSLDQGGLDKQKPALNNLPQGG